ncbi:MAG: hypothetical protein Fur0032_23300 [Terrimicrobiaceae bacterium]
MQLWGQLPDVPIFYVNFPPQFTMPGLLPIGPLFRLGAQQVGKLEGVMHLWRVFAGEDFGDSRGASEEPVSKAHWPGK